ncbi:MAG: GNAT family N-acetyltransferase [Pseudodesulfovibrio sp.]
MAYRLRILSPAEVHGFAAMTFPAYRSRLGNGTLAVGAYSGNVSAGLALISPLSDRTTVELLSLYIDFPHRLQGIGAMLLGHAEKTLKRANIPSIHTSWSETLPGAPALQAVLVKSGWSEPYKRMFTLRGDMDGDFGKGVREMYPKYESSDCLPRKYQLSRWFDMTDADRAFIKSKEGQPNWHEPRANPFRDEATMESTNSLVLRKDGDIAGWLTVHRSAPDTLRYTDVFIRADLKRAGAVAISMVTHAFWLHLKEGTPKLTMGVEKDNEPLIRMYENRMAIGANLSWTWGAEKILVE